MKKIIFALSLGAFAACTFSPNKQAEKKIREAYASEYSNNTITSIEECETYDAALIKDTLKLYIQRLDSCVKVINNLEAIQVITPQAALLKKDMTELLKMPDDRCVVFHILAERKGNEAIKPEMYANVMFDKDGKVKDDVTIIDVKDEPGFVSSYLSLKETYQTVISRMETMFGKSKEELAKMCEEEKARIALMIGENAAKAAAADPNAVRDAHSWGEVAAIIKKRGTIDGIWRDSRDLGKAMTIFHQGKEYFVAPCQYTTEPVSDETVIPVTKVDDKTYLNSRGGGGRQQKFVVTERILDYLEYTPGYGGSEGTWKYTGTYIKVY